MNKIVIASRGSKLALWQAEYVAARIAEHSQIETEIKVYKTQGDVILDAPLAKIGGKGLFTKELEDAILSKEAHIAVHSLKDVPTVLPSGLILAGVTERADRRDCLISDKYESLDAMPHGAVVGTTSLRRRMQLLAKRPDLIIKNLRGNITSRFDKLKDGLYDAIVLARAGIGRLGMTRAAKHINPFDTDIMLPAMGQGILGIECAAYSEVIKFIEPLFDKKAAIESAIERSFVDCLNGGCQAPIGVSAELFNDGAIYARGIVGLPDGKKILSAEVRGDIAVYEGLGEELANKLLVMGARAVIGRAEEMAGAIL